MTSIVVKEREDIIEQLRPSNVLQKDFDGFYKSIDFPINYSKVEPIFSKHQVDEFQLLLDLEYATSAECRFFSSGCLPVSRTALHLKDEGSQKEESTVQCSQNSVLLLAKQEFQK